MIDTDQTRTDIMAMTARLTEAHEWDQLREIAQYVLVRMFHLDGVCDPSAVDSVVSQYALVRGASRITGYCEGGEPIRQGQPEPEIGDWMPGAPQDFPEPNEHQLPEIPQDVARELVEAWKAVISYTDFRPVYPHVADAVDKLLARVPEA